MKIVEFLQSLSAKLLRLAFKRQSGMIPAPTAQQQKNVREHLRYWPYVKAFYPTDETHIKVLVFVGRGISEAQWNYYLTRSCELMNLCVRQYQSWLAPTNECPTFCLHRYHRNGFLRPNDMLKPFCIFIDEIDN